MTLQGWPYIHDPGEDRIRLMLLISLLMHASGIGTLFIYPLLIKPASIKVPVLEIVQLEIPKVTLRRPKTVPKTVKKEPIQKKEAPKFTPQPKPAVTKNVPREVKRKPDTTKVEKVVEEIVKDLTPKMVMKEIGDPRLRLWCRRVQKIIQTRWHPPRGIGIFGQAAVAVDFTVLKSGQINNPGIGKTSGNRDLDGFAVNTIERVGKLPPFPPNYREKDELSVQFIFHYAGE